MLSGGGVICHSINGNYVRAWNPVLRHTDGLGSFEICTRVLDSGNTIYPRCLFLTSPSLLYPIYVGQAPSSRIYQVPQALHL
jgi:hypothetical protein